MSSVSRIALPAVLALTAPILVSCGAEGGGGTGPSTGTIRGTVAAGGVGLEVSVGLSGPESRTVGTDASGAFEFSGLRPGSYTVSISDIPADADFDVTEKTAELADGGETVTVAFQGTLLRGAVEGTVTTGLGPVGGVTVRLEGPEFVEIETREGGTFRADVRAGSYTASLVDLDTLHYAFPDREKVVRVGFEETVSLSFQGTDLWGPCALGRLKDGARLGGTLEEGDCTTGAGGFRDVYVYYGSPGETLEARVDSATFDAIVLLRGSDGAVVTTGGEEGGAAGAGLTHTFEGVDRFWIEVSSTDPAATGSYTLSVEGRGGPSGVWGSGAAGWFHSCGIVTDGEAYCWGRNRSGQLGDGNQGEGVFRSEPGLVSGEITFTSISGGASSTCAVDGSGAAFCWGSNHRGELGIGTAEPGDFRPTPQPVTGGLRFSRVSVGADHACGLTTRRSRIYCWGGDAEGQLGTRSGRSPEPLPVESDRAYAMVSAGWFYTCALDDAGEGLCWGANSSGELGTDEMENALVPTPVAGGLRFRTIAAGFAHTCGITEDGRAYCWGDNGSGQLGIGSATPGQLFRAPRRVAGGMSFVEIAVGGSHTCALNPEGRAFCWGSGTQGQLGRGELGGEVALEPTPVDGDLTFRSIHAGLSHTCAVTTGGDMYCWGANSQDSSGALGIGTTGNEGTPVRVSDPEG